MKNNLFFLFCFALLLLTSCKKNSGSSGTCSDGILNQNETAVDCGGSCSKCATCSDGIQNQGETGIDCGGPCGACSISYPIYGFFGGNILRDDTITLTPQSLTQSFFNNYSMAANIPVKSTLRVKLINASTNGFCTFVSGSQTGWTQISWSQAYQEYFVNFPVESDISLTFTGHSTAKVEIYENGSSTPTRTKSISW